MNQDPYIGTVIEEKYSVDRKIGEGGMGAVYVGTQRMVDRPVAIKLLHTDLSTHERFKQRFEVEAKAIGRLNHPNCITIYDFGFSQDLDAFYMVMEYLEGDPMHVRVVQGVSAKEAVSITQQIAVALDHAHHQGILHRDLKPENIILSKMTDGSELVKVLDFGIARIFEDDNERTTEESNRLTHAGEVFGTPAYISPEQARGERHLSPASDLYSLGIMLFEMLEGKLPYWGNTAIETIMQHLQDPIPQLTRIDVPQSLKDVVIRLMSKEAEQRFQSGKELSEALRLIESQFESGNHAHIAPPMARQQYHSTPTNMMPGVDEHEWDDIPETIASPPPSNLLAMDIKTARPNLSTSPSYQAPPSEVQRPSNDTEDGLHTKSPSKLKIGALAVVIVLVCVCAGVIMMTIFQEDGAAAPKLKEPVQASANPPQQNNLNVVEPVGVKPAQDIEVAKNPSSPELKPKNQLREPDGIKPEETKPEEVKPEETKPEEVKPERIRRKPKKKPLVKKNPEEVKKVVKPKPKPKPDSQIKSIKLNDEPLLVKPLSLN